MKAVICPVCNGSGKYYIPPPEGCTAAIGDYITCHGCGGKGWVEIEDEQSVYPYEPDNTTLTK